MKFKLKETVLSVSVVVLIGCIYFYFSNSGENLRSRFASMAALIIIGTGFVLVSGLLFKLRTRKRNKE